VAKKEDVVVEEKQRETTVEFLASLAAVLVTGLFIITFVLQAFEIPSSSMEDTLLIGDHVFVNREQFAPRTTWLGPLMPYRDIKRGDIVVFLSPSEPGLYVVKRIMGIPGDRIHLRDGVVYRNGEKLNEPYVMHKGPLFYDPYRDNFPAVAPSEAYNVTAEWKLLLPSHVEGDDVVVPKDSYFGMGDNRDVSLDSRCSYTGRLTRRRINIVTPISANGSDSWSMWSFTSLTRRDGDEPSGLFSEFPALQTRMDAGVRRVAAGAVSHKTRGSTFERAHRGLHRRGPAAAG
jgi:signal peptidase I